jgi:hypothetical protein
MNEIKLNKLETIVLVSIIRDLPQVTQDQLKNCSSDELNKIYLIQKSIVSILKKLKK